MKVLIADDDPMSRRLLESSLRRWGYDTVAASDGAEAAKILLGPDAPTLAILDWLMPGMDGVELCVEVRRRKPEPYTYILLLTGKADQAEIVEGLEAGADDYVTKPFDPSELRVRLRTGKRILYLQDQLIAAREALRDRATRDQLTGLCNRGAVLEMLESEVRRALREGASCGVVMADVDHFKRVNDTHGHLAGDAVLREVAKTMKATARRYDSIGRYGGEEFLIVLPGCDESNAVSHAERLRQAIEKLTIATEAGELQVTMSFGVAVLDAGAIKQPFDLIQAADTALYQAKREGRNQVQAADSLEFAVLE